MFAILDRCCLDSNGVVFTRERRAWSDDPKPSLVYVPHRNAYDIQRVAVFDVHHCVARYRTDEPVEEDLVRQIDARVAIGSLVHSRLMFSTPPARVMAQMA
jgi:hypothetical protein